MFERLWKKRTTTEEPAPTPPTITYTDERTGTQADERQALRTEQAALQRERGRFAEAQARKDPAGFLTLAETAPRVKAHEAEVGRLTEAIAARDLAITGTQATAVQYAARATDTAAWLDPLLAGVPSADAIREAQARSREIDALAATLLRESGDRQFRRPLIDPFAALRTALEDRLRVIDRTRLLRSVPDRHEPNTKTAS